MMWKDCPHCEQSFALQSTLNKHLASDHGKLNERNSMVATLNEKDHRIAELEAALRLVADDLDTPPTPLGRAQIRAYIRNVLGEQTQK